MAMSIHKLPAIADYWKDDWILGVPAFARIMSRNRFQEILRYFHVNNNENMLARENENYDKLFKIRPLIESLKVNFQLQYNPHFEQSIDEAMVKYKGRTSLKQYMPLKPIKRGIKRWCRADSHAGYLCDFEVYSGKQKDGIENGLAYTVVTNLCKSIYGKWHKIFFDNFFTSYQLIEELYMNKTCGTVRAGRKNFPAEIFGKDTTKKMNWGELEWRSKGPVSVVTWIDKKPVHVAGTVTKTPGSEEQTMVKRWWKDGEQEDIPCPEIIKEYNQFMGGVNKNDQLKSYYSINLFTKKRWTRLFFDLVDRAVVNSYLLEKESTNHKKRPLKDFKVSLAKELVGDFTSKKTGGWPSLDNQAKFTERHFPDLMPMKENGSRSQRRCVVCSKENWKKLSSYFCCDCDVGLCPAPCFRNYHSR